jgi:hypothetical protein
VVVYFADGQHALRLGSNIDDRVRRRKLHHGAFQHVVFAGKLLRLGGEALERAGKIVGRRLCSSSRDDCSDDESDG